MTFTLVIETGPEIDMRHIESVMKLVASANIVHDVTEFRDLDNPGQLVATFTIQEGPEESESTRPVKKHAIRATQSGAYYIVKGA